MTAVQIAIRVLREGAVPPRYQTAGAAGMDLQACPEEAGQIIRLAPQARCLVPTGIAIAVPPGYEAQVRPRSGWALKQGVTVLNSPGTIDSDYRGEIKVLLINLGTEEVLISAGDRIAQLVVAPVAQVAWSHVSSLDETQRGEGGYGHTGGVGQR